MNSAAEREGLAPPSSAEIYVEKFSPGNHHLNSFSGSKYQLRSPQNIRQSTTVITAHAK
jgi:hypothetical protein